MRTFKRSNAVSDIGEDWTGKYLYVTSKERNRVVDNNYALD
jgi:hypothetical protein